VLLNDPFEHRRVAAVIPHSFGPDDRDRARLAHPQTIDLGPCDAAAFGQSQNFQARFQIVPCNETALAIAAFGLGLVAAQENVPPGVEAAEIVENLRGERDFFG